MGRLITIGWRNKVTFKVSEKNFSEFINQCKAEEIVLRNIHKIPEGYLCTVSFDDFKRIRPAVRKASVTISVCKKEGALYYVHRRRKRYGFYLGGICALILYIYLTSCIWVVDVTGNSTTSTEEILKVLDDNGIGIGTIKYGKKISDIKNKCLIELDSLTWMWVTIDGTRAVVDVREHKTGQEIFDRNICSNLVATYPGQIVDMRVRNGRKTVSRGDIVSAGDLLVSGISDTKYEGVRFIHSSGEVFARTWRRAEGEFPLSRKKIKRTGNVLKKYSIEILGKPINNIFRKKDNYKDSEKITNKKQLKIFNNIYLPLSFTTESFYEIITINEPLSEDKALKAGTEVLVKQIEDSRHSDAITTDRKVESRLLDNGNLYISVTLESIENIAGESLLQVDLSEEYTFGENN